MLTQKSYNNIPVTWWQSAPFLQLHFFRQSLPYVPNGHGCWHVIPMYPGLHVYSPVTWSHVLLPLTTTNNTLHSINTKLYKQNKLLNTELHSFYIYRGLSVDILLYSRNRIILVGMVPHNGLPAIPSDTDTFQTPGHKKRCSHNYTSSYSLGPTYHGHTNCHTLHLSHNYYYYYYKTKTKNNILKVKF